MGLELAQTEWVESNKTNPFPGRQPAEPQWTPLKDDGTPADPANKEEFSKALEARNKRLETTMADYRVWIEAYRLWWIGNAACFIQAISYTLIVYIAFYKTMPLIVATLIFIANFALDRFDVPKLFANHRQHI